MSRLDSFIARMQAQRDCLNFLKPAIDALPGPILEVGLGNGRTYDHLRDLFPGRDIYVFERKVAAHPACIPPDYRLFLGEARQSIPEAAKTLGARAALIHTDLGTGDHQANMAMGSSGIIGMWMVTRSPVFNPAKSRSMAATSFTRL